MEGKGGPGRTFCAARGNHGGLQENVSKALPEEGKGGRGTFFAQLWEIMGARKKTFPRPHQRRVKGAGAHLLCS